MMVMIATMRRRVEKGPEVLINFKSLMVLTSPKESISQLSANLQKKPTNGNRKAKRPKRLKTCKWTSRRLSARSLISSRKKRTN